MRVALTGTPGTGKTRLAKALARRGHFVLDVSAEAVRLKAVAGRDRRRGSLEVDLAKLDRALARESRRWPEGFPIILEGHLSHLLTVERAIVLRCPPGVLARRLRARGWSERKIRENACAEAVGVIITEAVERLGPERVYEINTASTPPGERARLAERIAWSGGRAHRAGRIDFLEEAMAWC